MLGAGPPGARGPASQAAQKSALIVLTQNAADMTGMAGQKARGVKATDGFVGMGTQPGQERLQLP